MCRAAIVFMKVAANSIIKTHLLQLHLLELLAVACFLLGGLLGGQIILCRTPSSWLINFNHLLSL